MEPDAQNPFAAPAEVGVDPNRGRYAAGAALAGCVGGIAAVMGWNTVVVISVVGFGTPAVVVGLVGFGVAGWKAWRLAAVLRSHLQVRALSRAESVQLGGATAVYAFVIGESLLIALVIVALRLLWTSF